jgi:transcription elongation factor SPT5
MLEPVVPTHNGWVKVIRGDDREAVGELITIEDVEGVVKFGPNKIMLLQLNHLCKCTRDAL